jgi:hypothetical protein
MRIATAIVLVLAIGLVMISPISELDPAVHHHRSHHSQSLSLNADVVLMIFLASMALNVAHKPVYERALTSRAPAFLRC